MTISALSFSMLILITIIYFFSLKNNWLAKIKNPFCILFQSISYIAFGISLFKKPGTEKNIVSHINLPLGYIYVLAASIVIAISIEKNKKNNSYKMKTGEAFYYSSIIAMTLLAPPIFADFFR